MLRYEIQNAIYLHIQDCIHLIKKNCAKEMLQNVNMDTVQISNASLWGKWQFNGKKKQHSKFETGSLFWC